MILCVSNAFSRSLNRVSRLIDLGYPIVRFPQYAYKTTPICSNQKNSLSDPALLNYLSILEAEYWSLYVQEGHDVQGKQRLKELLPTIKIMEERKCVQDNIKNLEELSPSDANDPDMKELIKEEHKVYNSVLAKLDSQLLESIIPVDSADNYQSMILEVTAGVGGQEAMLFARELLDMYFGYIEYKGWSHQIAELDSSEIGGIRHASILINGDGAYKGFRHEAGVHRVQRIPSTEKSGRVHTSTVTVASLPQPSDVDIVLMNKDLRIETKRASGAGGQHVNTTDSAVRIVHIPTGMAVECQEERSQLRNRDVAMARLRAKLYEQQVEKQQAATKGMRKAQVGSSLRNEKIRTYNYSQDRITDHRLSGSSSGDGVGGAANIHNLKVFLQGGEDLDELISRLDKVSRREILQHEINSVIQQYKK